MIYADASVIVKRYREEGGSVRVHEGWVAAERVFTSWVADEHLEAAARRERLRVVNPERSG
ncbi:MAG: hypothetical protein HY712_07130 [candidate division NC10 bacterium]|nr:hypothetical protein [candidate division NC10 bacterium]